MQLLVLNLVNVFKDGIKDLFHDPLDMVSPMPVLVAGMPGTLACPRI